MNKLDALFDHLARTFKGDPIGNSIRFTHGGLSLEAYATRHPTTGAVDRLRLATSFPSPNSKVVPYESSGANFRSEGKALPVPRPMQIELSRENRQDVENKESGAVTEIQTGDPAFDSAVFIRTNSSAEVVKYCLGPQLVRAGALQLFELGARVVIIDHADGTTMVSLSSIPAHLAVDASFVGRLLDTFTAFCDHLPLVEHSGESPKEEAGASRLWGPISLLVIMGGIFSCFVHPFLSGPAACLGRTRRGGIAFNCNELPNGNNCCDFGLGVLLLGLPLAYGLARLLILPFDKKSTLAEYRGLTFFAVFSLTLELSVLVLSRWRWGVGF